MNSSCESTTACYWKMEAASLRIFKPSGRPNPHFSTSFTILPKPPRRTGILAVSPCNPPRCSIRFRSSFHYSSISLPNSSPLRFSQSLSASRIFDSSLSEWDFDSEEGAIVTVVMLGWLGAKPNQLKRYVELYNSRGIRAVTFLASVTDVLWFDLGRTMQERIAALAGELVSWLGETQKDGIQRFLVFHTFSNTGWLVYGEILNNLQDRQDLLMKIKGCVVDSGGDPDINPKVWAAGFTVALLKKHSSSRYPSTEAIKGLESEVSLTKIQQKEPSLIEIILLLVFEKLFSFLLNLPHVNKRLTKTIFTLSKKQPPCPQLYLYSTADKIIPSRSVELFIEEQRRIGRKVWSFNFVSSPHVDHYRTFPDIYSSQIQNFLELLSHSEQNVKPRNRLSS